MKLKFQVLLGVMLTAVLFSPAWGQLDGAVGGGLEDALRLAVTQHPSIKRKLFELKALGSDLESAEYQRLPAVTLQAQSLSHDQDQVVAVLQQPLWVGGRIDGNIRQAEVGLNSGGAALLETQRKILEDTAAAYALLLGARQRLQAAELNVGEHEKLKNLIARREEGGIASSADLLLAESRLSQAVSQRIQFEGALIRAQNDLLALTQQPVSAQDPVPEPLLALPAEDQTAELIVQASAAVKQRILDVEQAQVQSSLAKAAMMPSLFAKVQQDVYSDADHSRETVFGLALQGSVEGLGLVGLKKVRSSDTRVDAARKEVAAAQIEVRRQAQTLMTNIQSLRLMLDSNERLVQSTEETLASFMRQYDAGRKSWVDVLNAQREFSEARLAFEQTKSSLAENSLRLAAQLGQLDSLVGAIE